MAGTSSLKKPQMRRLHASFLKFHITVGSVLACAGGLAYYVFVARERRRKYEEFYKNYDAEKECEEIASKGYFQSFPIK